MNSVDPDLKSSQVTVKGVFDPPKLVEYVYKRTGKHAVIVKQEVEKKKDEEKGGEKEAKGEEKTDDKKGEEGKNVGGDGGGGAVEELEETKVVETKKNESQYYPYHLRYTMDIAYAPQIFSDENPNACSVM